MPSLKPIVLPPPEVHVAGPDIRILFHTQLVVQEFRVFSKVATHLDLDPTEVQNNRVP